MSAQKSFASSPVSAVSSESNLAVDKARSAFDDVCEQAKDLPEMSLEEINAEIREARKFGRGFNQKHI